jgi:hypothetical protein
MFTPTLPTTHRPVYLHSGARAAACQHAQSRALATPAEVFALGALVEDVVADLSALGLQHAHHGCRWVVVKHLLERLIVDDELSTPVSNLIAVDPAHEALVK